LNTAEDKDPVVQAMAFMVDDDPDLRSRIGQWLGVLRKQRGIPQEEAAKAIGVSRPHLSNVELGRSRPGWKGLQQMATYYSLELNDTIAKVRAAREAENTSGAAPSDEWRVMIGPKRHAAITSNPLQNLSGYERWVLSGLSELPRPERDRLMDEIVAAIQRHRKNTAG
jgi:transcriptional regulator with XRE-family HTH domain